MRRSGIRDLSAEIVLADCVRLSKASQSRRRRPFARSEREGFIGRMFAALVLLAFVAVVADARADVLSGEDLRKLLAGGPEGTTILFQGGTDKVFYSAALKNRLRRSPQLGVDFLKQKVQPNTVSEGVFISATIDNGKWRMITGIAAVAADHDSGHGVLTMIQTFPEDSTINAFQKRDRLYAVLVIEEAGGGIVCRRSRWEKLFAFKGEHKMTSVPCDFAVGNAIAPAAPVVSKDRQ